MLNIVKLKGCRRCGGDLFLEKDSEGTYISCLQCGASSVRRETPPPLRRIRERKELVRSG
jgi:hypothetical protein